VLWDREGKEITDWRAWTRPKRDYQWQPGRSAMELARGWFTSPEPICPPEVKALLATHSATAELSEFRGRPEYVTGLFESGGGRNHDLLLESIGSDGLLVVLSIEAKVDETFGPRVGKYWNRMREDKKSGLPARVEKLLRMLFGPRAHPDKKPWSELRYQLLTAVAGLAIEAANANAATGVLVIHELHTSEANEKRLAKNAADLAAFVGLTGLEHTTESSAQRLLGPVTLSAVGSQRRDVQILLGRAVYDWSAAPGAT
jgi:hypothetical protein